MARLRFALLVAVMLVAGHDVTYAIANGIGGLSAALRDTGHDGYWTPTVLLVTATASAGLVLVLWRRGRLMRELRRLNARRRALSLRAAFGAPTFFMATRLAVVALLIFVTQENVEHYSAHAGHLPGLGVLGGDGYEFTLPVFSVLAVALAALVRYITVDSAELLAAIALGSSLPRLARGHSRGRPDWVNLPRTVSATARPDLGRAPPLVLAS